MSRFNTDGRKVWSKKFTSPSNTYVTCIAVDSQDNLLVGGLFYKSMTVENTTFTLDSSKYNGGYLVKLQPDGTVIWAHQYSTMGTNYLSDVKVDSDGSIYMAGQQDFHGYLAKASENGNLVWQQTVGGGVFYF